jgi:hypothetical protein
MLLCAAISILGMYLTQRFIEDVDDDKKNLSGDSLLTPDSGKSDDKLSSSFS